MQIFIPIPISENPAKDGDYNVVFKGVQLIQKGEYKRTEWSYLGHRIKPSHWIKVVEVSEEEYKKFCKKFISPAIPKITLLKIQTAPIPVNPIEVPPYKPHTRKNKPPTCEGEKDIF